MNEIYKLKQLLSCRLSGTLSRCQYPLTSFYRQTDGEYLREPKEDLSNIEATGIQIEIVICDGAPNILHIVREVCPDAILQRCTVHIELEIKKKPQIPAAQELLELVGLLAPCKRKMKPNCESRPSSSPFQRPLQRLCKVVSILQLECR